MQGTCAAASRARWTNWSGLELDLHEDELEAVGVDDVVLDADLAGVRHPGPQGRRNRRLSVKNMQLARRHGHDDIVVVMAMPAGMAARRKAPLGDDDAVVLDLDGGLRERALIGTHGEKLMRYA